VVSDCNACIRECACAWNLCWRTDGPEGFAAVVQSWGAVACGGTGGQEGEGGGEKEFHGW
jgi:hypothetical protein